MDECFDLIPEAFSAFDDAEDISMDLEPCGSLPAGVHVAFNSCTDLCCLCTSVAHQSVHLTRGLLGGPACVVPHTCSYMQ